MPGTEQSPLSVCLLLQDLLQSCSRGGGRRVDDMCYDRRRAEACVDESARHARSYGTVSSIGLLGQNCKPYMVLWYLLSIHSLSNPNADILVTSLVLKHCAHALRQPRGSHHNYLQGKEAALTHTNRHTGRASTVLRLGWLRCPADLSEDGSKGRPSDPDCVKDTICCVCHPLT